MLTCRPRLLTSVLVLVGLGTVAPVRAQEGTALRPPRPATDPLPAYAPGAPVTGTLTTWGHVFVKDAMHRWERGFQRFHPGIRYADNLVSSAAATGALFTRTADIGFVGREIRPLEVAGYARVMKQKPLGFRVMTGSFANADKLIALGIFVHRDNPLARLNFAQLDAIFGSEHLRSPGLIRTWGQLGLTGPWADRPIQVYTGELDAAPGFYFSQTVMGGSLLWNAGLRHFDDVPVPGGRDIEAGQRIVDALAADPGGIALSGAGYRNPAVKLLALARSAGDAPVKATPGHVADRTYPLARFVWLFVNREPDGSVAPKVREFLRYILSREGQADVAAEGEYMPLTPEVVQEELRKLR
jgi:phosphate transport system substrate-binding protein